MTKAPLSRSTEATTDDALKILFIVESAATGVGRHLFDLIDGIVAQRHQVDILYSPIREDDLFRRSRAQRPGIFFRSIPMHRAPHPEDLKVVMSVRRHIAEFGPYDIVHGHSSKGGMLARLAGIGMSCQVVYTPHAILTLDPTLPWPLRHLVRGGERALSLLTDAIVAVSSGERSHIVELGIPPGKVHLIFNGITPATLPPRDTVRRKLGLSPEQVAIGFVGRLSHHKAIDIMVSAFMRVHAAVPQARLIVIGDGDAGSAAHRQAEMAGCANEISWLGARDALPYYNGFDLLAQPSRYEALSYVLLEAASSGLPVIASDVGGTRDVIEDDVNGMVVAANDPEAFGTGLLAMITTPGKLHRYTAAAKGRTVSGGRTKMVGKTLALYRSLVLASPHNRGF